MSLAERESDSMSTNPERFDVFIVELESGKAVSLIGQNLREDKAERRIETGVSRINLDRAFVTMKPAGKFKVGDEL